MAADIVERFLGELLEDLEHNRLVLPTLPEVALRVREVVDDENASITDITRVVSSDAALGARLIQVANSPLMRASRPIDTLDAAVTRLGIKLVRDMVTSIAMEQMFQATSELTDRKLRQLWEHSSQVAAISHALASCVPGLQPQEAMLGGLVHDIGSLPILTKAEDHPELLEDEATLDRILNRLHPRVGGMILRAWRFPAELVKVAELHEKLDRDSEEADYVDVVTVANLQSYIGTDHPVTRLDWSTIPAFAKLGLSPEINVVEMDETAEEIREVKSLLGV